MQKLVFKITAFFILTLCSRLCMRVGILITCWKHLHDCIISLREDWAHATIVAPPLFIEVSVQSQESQLSWICVNVYPICLYLRFCIFDFGIVLIVRFFCFFFHCIISYSWYAWQHMFRSYKFIFKIIISCL